jgi:hypothetical protein
MANFNMFVILDVTPCSLVNTNRRFRGVYSGIVSQCLPDYTTQHPIRQTIFILIVVKTKISPTVNLFAVVKYHYNTMVK